MLAPLQDAIDKSLKAASQFLVVGQESKAYKDSTISATAEKFRLDSFFGRVSERGDIRIRMDIKDPHPMENPAFDFKVSYVHARKLTPKKSLRKAVFYCSPHHALTRGEGFKLSK